MPILNCPYRAPPTKTFKTKERTKKRALLTACHDPQSRGTNPNTNHQLTKPTKRQETTAKSSAAKDPQILLPSRRLGKRQRLIQRSRLHRRQIGLSRRVRLLALLLIRRLVLVARLEQQIEPTASIQVSNPTASQPSLPLPPPLRLPVRPIHIPLRSPLGSRLLTVLFFEIMIIIPIHLVSHLTKELAD